tara:strand:- start:419 stop:640 length:222 start_codon:yes stop_codon:yes gene_type:complete
MELKHRKKLIEFFIQIKVKNRLSIANDLEKLTKDRFKHWNFQHIETEIINYYLSIDGTIKEAKQKIKELKEDY